jgi:small subunit ribosomal protein S6
MRNYEVVIIFHPDLDETALAAIIEKVKGWITEAGGMIESTDLWGKRRMAYIIRKQREGQYVYIQAAMPPVFSNELDRNLRLTEPVMRYLITAK